MVSGSAVSVPELQHLSQPDDLHYDARQNNAKAEPQVAVHPGADARESSSLERAAAGQPCDNT
jgi:hypothetical protein